jgi:hypothetical protein
MAHKRNFIIFSFLLVFLGASIFYIILTNKEGEISPSPVPDDEQSEVSGRDVPEPKRDDYGTTLPPTFPQDLLPNGGEGLIQSYTLTYPDSEQKTILLHSPTSVGIHYKAFLSLLKNNGWEVINEYEDLKIAALYARKEGVEVNVTLNSMQVDGRLGTAITVSILTFN